MQAAHERLHLSSTQEAAWGDVNKVLQENQKAAGAIFKERAGNAVDAVRQGIKAAETRISNLKRLGGVLEKFYASLTEAQQRVLDEAVCPTPMRLVFSLTRCGAKVQVRQASGLARWQNGYAADCKSVYAS